MVEHKVVDSLVANEFAVELNGEQVDGVFRVSNLQTYVSDVDGTRQMPPFEIAKMVQRDPNNPVNTWIRETMDSRNNGDRPRRDVTVVAIDDGVVIRRWTAKAAWLWSISYSDFNTASTEMVEEVLVIGYEDIEEEWTAGS